MSRADVLVLGDTTEAVLAAIFARRRGARVALCPRPRALACGPVTFELFRPSAAEILAGRHAIEETLRRLASDHPYRGLFPAGTTGVDARGILSQARLASEAFRNLLETWGMPFSGELHQLRLALTEVGTLGVAGLGPSDLAILKRGAIPERAEIVALAHDACFHGALVAASLGDALPQLALTLRSLDLGVATCSSPFETSLATPWERLAEALPRDSLPRLAAPRRLPTVTPILGLLELLPVDAPSAPGLRVQAALLAALQGLGVEIVDAQPGAIDTTGTDPAVAVTHAEGRWERLEAGRIVVAPGKFARGGLVAAPELRCPMLGNAVPVWLGDRAEERIDGERHFARTVFSPHDAFRMGIRVDAQLRPLGREGAPVHPRVHAAGTVIGGADAASEGSGLVLLTAWLAAHRALEAA